MRDRLVLLVLVAAPLAAFDLALKELLPADPRLYHARDGGWVALSAALLLASVLLARLPSRLVAASAGVFAAGVLGNLISARAGGLVPNPFVLRHGRAGIAFNLADVLVLAGIALLTVASMRVAIRFRHLLPQSTVAVRLVRRLRR